MWFKLWRQKRKLTFSQKEHLRYYLQLLGDASRLLGNPRLDDPAATRLEKTRRAEANYQRLCDGEKTYRLAEIQRQGCRAEGVPRGLIELAEKKQLLKYHLRHDARTASVQKDLIAAHLMEGL